MTEQGGDSTQGDPDRSGGRGGRARRWPSVVLLGLGVVAAGWTAAWAVARSRVSEEVDRQLERFGRAGITIVCQERSIGGFPFRFEISCRNPGVTMPLRGATVTASALRVVAQAWDPFLVIAEVDGPVAASDGRGAVEATWERAALSLRWKRSGAERLSLAADGVRLSAHGAGPAVTRFSAPHVEGHGRASGAEGRDLDLALATAAATLELDGKRIGPEHTDFSATTTLVDFLPPGPGEALQAFAGRGGMIGPIGFTLASGGLSFTGKGALRVLADGMLDGSVAVAGKGLESLAMGGTRALGAEAATLATGFILLGKPSTDADLPGRRLDLVVDHGRPRLGRVVFGPIPPLFVPNGVR